MTDKECSPQRETLRSPLHTHSHTHTLTSTLFGELTIPSCNAVPNLSPPDTTLMSCPPSDPPVPFPWAPCAPTPVLPPLNHPGFHLCLAPPAWVVHKSITCSHGFYGHLCDSVSGVPPPSGVFCGGEGVWCLVKVLAVWHHVWGNPQFMYWPGLCHWDTSWRGFLMTQ